jgi:hypothetical protein
MWKKGTVAVGGVEYEYAAKVYETGSNLGIDGGRVSKLEIRRDGHLVCNYDRGWDVVPEGGQDTVAYDTVMRMFE